MISHVNNYSMQARCARCHQSMEEKQVLWGAALLVDNSNVHAEPVWREFLVPIAPF